MQGTQIDVNPQQGQAQARRHQQQPGPGQGRTPAIPLHQQSELTQGNGAEGEAIGENLPLIPLGDRELTKHPLVNRWRRGGGETADHRRAGGWACTSVLRSGPAGTIPEGCRGNRAPK